MGWIDRLDLDDDVDVQIYREVAAAGGRPVTKDLAMGHHREKPVDAIL